MSIMSCSRRTERLKENTGGENIYSVLRIIIFSVSMISSIIEGSMLLSDRSIVVIKVSHNK